MGIHVAHEQDRYLEELYAAVQRSAEVGVKLVNQFCAFYSTIALGAPVVSAGPLEEFIEDRLKRYRNLLHDGMLAMPKDVRGRRVMPLPPAVRELPADRGLAADGTSFVKWSRRERPES